MSEIRTYLSDLTKHEGRIEKSYQIHRQSAPGADRTSFDAGYEAACSFFWNERSPAPSHRLRVKPLEWRRGYCDDQVTISQAYTIGGLLQVRVLNGVVWLDEPGVQKPGTATIYPSVEAAQAAAQAVHERSIHGNLDTESEPSCAQNGETFKGAIDTDARLQAAAREAGWALSELVDISDWQRRDQISDIIGRLAKALIDTDITAPQANVPGVTRDEAISFLEYAARNFDLPPLSEDEIGDVASGLLWFLNKRAKAAAETGK